MCRGWNRAEQRQEGKEGHPLPADEVEAVGPLAVLAWKAATILVQAAALPAEAATTALALADPGRWFPADEPAAAVGGGLAGRPIGEARDAAGPGVAADVLIRRAVLAGRPAEPA